MNITIAPFFLSTPNSSSSNATKQLYIAIADVNPAKNNKKNQTAPNILPPAIVVNTFGNAINAKPILPFIPSGPRNA